MPTFKVQHSIGDTVYVKTKSNPPTVEERVVLGWCIDHLEGTRDDPPQVFYRLNGDSDDYYEKDIASDPSTLFGYLVVSEG